MAENEISVTFEATADTSKAEAAMQQFGASTDATMAALAKNLNATSAQMSKTIAQSLKEQNASLEDARRVYEQLGISGAQANQEIAKAFGTTVTAANQGTESVARTGNQLRQAQASAIMLEQQFGIHMPRAVNTMLARVEGIGPLMSRVFAAGIVIFLGEQIVRLLIKVNDLVDGLGNVSAAYRHMQDAAVKSTDQALEHAKTQEQGLKNIAEANQRLLALELAHSSMFERIDIRAKAALESMSRHWYDALLGPLGVIPAIGSAVKGANKAMEDQEKEITRWFDILHAATENQNKLNEEANRKRDEQERRDEAAAKRLEEQAARTAARRARQENEFNQSLVRQEARWSEFWDRLINREEIALEHMEAKTLKARFPLPDYAQLQKTLGGIDLLTQGVKKLTAEEYAALPAFQHVDAALQRQLETARNRLNSMALESSAHRRIIFEFYQRIDAATREINKLRELAEQGKITFQQMKEAEQAYTDTVLADAKLRDESLRQEMAAKAASVIQEAANLLTLLGYRKAAAMVEGIWQTAEGFASLAKRDFWAAAQHFLSAAQYFIIAGQTGKADRGAGAGGPASTPPPLTEQQRAALPAPPAGYTYNQYGQVVAMSAGSYAPPSGGQQVMVLLTSSQFARFMSDTMQNESVKMDVNFPATSAKRAPRTRR